MKGVVFVGDRKLELRDFPDPTPGPRDVVLEIKASGMCGSDLHVYRASFRPGDVTSGFKRGAEPVIAGHEPCGVVVAVGAGVTDREARIGARVMDHHYTGCGGCKHCRSGWAQMCLEGPTVFGATPLPTSTTTPQGSCPAITGSAPRANPEVVSPGLKTAR